MQTRSSMTKQLVLTLAIILIGFGMLKNTAHGVEVVVNPDAPPIYYSTTSRDMETIIHRLDGRNTEGIVSTLGFVKDIALDVQGGKIYWATQRLHFTHIDGKITQQDSKIWRANLDGTNIEDIISLSGLPSNIALDVQGNKIYWGSTAGIYRADLDGSNVENINTNYTSNSYISAIVLDAQGGKIYLANSSFNSIQHADLDGSNVQNLVTGFPGPSASALQSRQNDLSLDVQGGKIYWVDDIQKKIQRADLDGSNVQNLVTGFPEPGGVCTLALDVEGGKIYWEYNRTIWRAHLDGSSTEIYAVDAPRGCINLTIAPPQSVSGRSTGNVQSVRDLIPDQNLAGAVRKALGLDRNAPITQSAMQKLTKLEARERQIKNLTGLEHATQLTELDLYKNQIRNITPLSGLTRLKRLDLDQNQIRNIRPLIGLKQLEGLYLSGNQIKNKDVQLLANLTELRMLSLNANQIGKIEPLASLTKLERLWLEKNKIRDVSPLSGLVNLETLYLEGNPVKDLSPLANLPKLRDVDVEISKQGAPSTGTWLFIRKPPNLTPDNFTIGPGEFAILVHQGKRNVTKKADFKTYASYYAHDDNTDFPNLAQFFRNRGRIELVSHSSLNPLPPDTKEPQFGDIVISEIMWGLNGSSPAKQYIELYNASAHTYTFWDGNLSLRFSKASESALPDGVFPFPPNPNAHTKVVDRMRNKGWKVRGKGGNIRKKKPLISMYRTINYTTGAVPDGTVARSWKASKRRVNLPAPNYGTPGAKHTSSDADLAAAPLKGSPGSVEATNPEATVLLANYPNPFNPETWIPYQLAAPSDVKITIYDARGSVIRHLDLGYQPPGTYTSRTRAAYWDGRNTFGERVASGIYFYQLQANDVSSLRKMLILK